MSYAPVGRSPEQLITVIKTFVADPLSARPTSRRKIRVQRAAASAAVAALPLLGAAVRHAACARGRRADVLVVRRARARLTSGAASVEQTTTYSAVLVACMCMCTYARAHEHAQHARHLACERRTAAPMTAAVRSTRSTRFMQRGASSRAASSPPAGRTCRVVRPAAVSVRQLPPQGARNGSNPAASHAHVLTAP